MKTDALIFSIAVIIGFLFGNFIAPAIVPHLNTTPDDHYEIAQNITNGNSFSLNGIPVVWRTPLYIYIVAILLTLFNGTFWSIYLFNAILLGLGAVLIRHIALIWYPNNKFATIAGLIYPFMPFNLWYVGRIWSVVALTTTIVAIAYLFLELWQKITLKDSIIIGIIMGLSVSIKGTTLFLPIAIVGALLWKHKRNIKKYLSLLSLCY